MHKVMTQLTPHGIHWSCQGLFIPDPQNWEEQEVDV
jgi:hypothetical protein